MASRAPNNLAIDRAGTRLYANVVPISTDPFHYVTAFDLSQQQLANPRPLYQLKTLGKAYLFAHPTEERSLIVKSIHNEDGEVIDQVREVEAGKSPREIRVDIAAGIPADAPFDNLLDIRPLYSWDGDQIIAPLVSTGLVIKGNPNEQPVYVDYPEIGFEYTGKAIQAIETQNGKRRIVLSFWQGATAEEKCLLYTLDLDTLQYKLITQEPLRWIVYQVASADYDNEPWLIAGSRGKQSAVEITRTPMLAWLDPSGSSSFEPVEFLGEPVWQVELDDRGGHVVYLDSLSRSLVRLDPRTGELESDPDLYTDDINAAILVNTDASLVLLWEGTRLAPADWQAN